MLSLVILGSSAAQGLPSIAHARQLVLVVGRSWTSTDASLRLFERDSENSLWQKYGETVSVSTGVKGYAWGLGAYPDEVSGPQLGEWDLRSPAGVFAIPFTFGQLDPQSLGPFKIAYRRIDSSSFCVDDPNSKYYNQIVSLNSINSPDWKSAEPMGGDRGYRLGIMIAQNSDAPAVPSRGSWIFLHPGPSSGGTNGCTTTDEKEILSIMSWLDSSKNPVIVQLPEEEYQRRKVGWGIP